jgi:deoxycytidine triphosphate deaminase
MILNHEQIKLRNIIESPIESEFGNGSYNLTGEKIIDMKNNVNNSFTLKPQGMVYVVFKEKIKVPSNVIGFAHVKTTLTKLGIMATNIGIIDPNYNGYLSTLLINFGKSDLYICKGDPTLRVTFANIEEPEIKKELKQNTVDSINYLKNVQKNISNLDEKFLNLTSVKKEVTSHIFKVLIGLAIFFTAGNFALSAYFSHKSSSEKLLDMSITKNELIVEKLIESNNLLKMQLDNYNSKLIALQDSLKVQARAIKELKK